jgi:type VI secretion system secreted protein Hcp
MPVQINELISNGRAGSQADTYLFVKTARAGKLEGESTAKGFEGEILVHGWHWGAQASSAIGVGRTTSRRSYKNLTVTKRIDGATTKLLAALATNDQIKEARLTMCKAGGTESVGYFTLKLEGARITDFEVSMADDGLPVETIMFAFTKVEVQYRPQKGTGGGGAPTTFNDEILAD